MTEGELLAGRYELGAVLGRGGVAEVRAGRDLRLGRAVAVKTLQPELAERPDVRRRFEREAQAAARLAHGNVVAVHDVGEEESIPYIVMERVPGPALHQEMMAGPMDSARVRRLGSEILAALGAAHAAGLVHRDVKPGNVLLAADGSAKVTDFGIAKAVEDSPSTVEVDLTMAGQVIGTVAYMAHGAVGGQAGHRAERPLLGRGDPLRGPERQASFRRGHADQPGLGHPAGPAPPLAELRPDLDPALVAVVERAMAHHPEERFATAVEMATALGPRPPWERTPPRPSSPIPRPRCSTPGTCSSPPPVNNPPGGAWRARHDGGWRSSSSPGWRLASLSLGGAGGEGNPGGARPTPETIIPAPESGIPAPLDDALDRLEETVR